MGFAGGAGYAIAWTEGIPTNTNLTSVTLQHVEIWREQIWTGKKAGTNKLGKQGQTNLDREKRHSGHTGASRWRGTPRRLEKSVPTYGKQKHYIPTSGTYIPTNGITFRQTGLHSDKRELHSDIQELYSHVQELNDNDDTANQTNRDMRQSQTWGLKENDT